MGGVRAQGVSVALAGPGDMGPIAAVLADAVVHTRAHFGDEPPTEADVTAQFAAQGATHPWLVARETGGASGGASGGAFLGFAKASPWMTRRGYAWTVETSIYLEASARGRGVGRLLYDTLFALLAAQGYAVAIAGVALPNPASERLHEAVGMRACAVFDPVGFKFGDWIAVRYYQRVLNAGATPGEIRPVADTWGEVAGRDGV